jgi:hypothetical protein
MWAAVLIPMWLRNHDTATENRSAERFGQAMRVLSRKGAPEAESDPEASHSADSTSTSDSPHIPATSRVPDAVGAVTARTGAAARRVAQASAAVKDRHRRAPRAPLTLVQRRARTLGVLAGLTFVSTLLAIFTSLPLWVMLPFVGLLGAFLVHLRIQARQKLHRRSVGSSRAASTASTASTARPSKTASPAARATSRPADRADESVPVTADTDGATGASDASGVVQGPSRAVVVERKGSSGAADDDDAWRPNPLPLPTYVTAPKAVRPIKVIDLTTPGAWSSGRLFDDEVAEEDLLAAQVAEDELDALLDQESANPTESDPDRRAVGD